MEDTYTKEGARAIPTLQQWQKENPRRSLNEYFAEHGKQVMTSTVVQEIQTPITYNYTTVNTTVIVGNRKSTFMSILLTFIFGPLGLLYSSITGALLMVLLDIAAFVALTGSMFSIGSLGGSFAAIGLLGGLVWLVLIQWPLCIIWGIVATVKHNNRVSEGY